MGRTLLQGAGNWFETLERRAPETRRRIIRGWCLRACGCHVVFSHNAGHCRAVCGCQCRGWRDVCGVAGMAAGPVRSSSCASALRACRREHCGLLVSCLGFVLAWRMGWIPDLWPCDQTCCHVLAVLGLEAGSAASSCSRSGLLYCRRWVWVVTTDARYPIASAFDLAVLSFGH